MNYLKLMDILSERNFVTKLVRMYGIKDTSKYLQERGLILVGRKMKGGKENAQSINRK